MDSAYNVSDPTDWLQTEIPTFSPLENALRCQVCKDFFNTPMITTCSHTFCSICIRRCLSAEGKCPACRSGEQASKLRRNWAIEEVVANFQAARPAALKLARQSRDQREDGTRTHRSNKRRRVEQEESQNSDGPRRQTRSRTKRMQSPSTQESVEIISTDDEQQIQETEIEEQEPDDGLVSCPMCGQRMKEESVFGHLDRCNGENKQKQKKSQPTTFPIKTPSRPASTQPLERLPELNYSLLKDQPLRKKLQDLGIPNWGNRPLLIRRHVEWVNIWNANCDSDKPRSKRELLRDLDTWEHSQGGHAKDPVGSTNGFMSKDFDARAYASSNKDDFSRLIEQARKKPKIAHNQDSPDQHKVMQGQNGVESSSHEPMKNTIQDTNANYEQRHPYENNDEALSAVRDKVEAADQGHHVEPTQNEGFRDQNEVAESTIAPNPHTKPPEAQNEALLSQAHFGAHHRLSGASAAECELPEHLRAQPTKKVPMFMVPEEPVVDVENEPNGQ